MKKSTVIRLAIMLALAIGAALWWSRQRNLAPPPVAAETDGASSKGENRVRRTTVVTPDNGGRGAKLSPTEKAAQIDRIERDYDEIRAKATADYTAAGPAFPGGLNAFLRQLALLEREKHADFAAVLDARELEDLEMRETSAGKLVQRLLGDTAATEEQQRAVFRLQRAFEDQFALTFDLTPPALLARESSRQATQENIRTALGDALFASWLSGEGADYAQFASFAAKEGLPAGTALDLWRAKNEFTLGGLELAARPELAGEPLRAAQAALVQQTRARVLAILGAGAMDTANSEMLGWLPRK